MKDLGNPFMEETNDLGKLDTKEITDLVVVDPVYKAEKTGQTQYDI